MKSIWGLLVLISFSFSTAVAKDRYRSEQRSTDPVQQFAQANDSRLVDLVQNRKQANFVEAAGLVVSKLLPDDLSGRTHQKWMVKLSNGREVLAVYNTGGCPRVPLKVGDIVGVGGHFLWTNQGPLIHWLHKDPSGRRPPGYVELNGQRYCYDSFRK